MDESSSRKYLGSLYGFPMYQIPLNVDRSSVKPGTLWWHKKSESLYVVLGVAMCSTNGERDNKEESVIYYSLTHQALRYREISEFCDGGFVRAEVGKVQA